MIYHLDLKLLGSSLTSLRSYELSSSRSPRSDMENWRDRVSSQSQQLSPPTQTKQAQDEPERGMEGREDWPTLSSLLHFSLRDVAPCNLVSLALSQSLCHSARRRRRRCRGRRGKKKRLNQEPECSEWELSRSSKGLVAVATLRNIPTRFQF